MESADLHHYATLGLARGCSEAQIRAAYRALTKQHHPDLHPGSAEAAAQMQTLNAAYEILSDPALRLAYDRELDAACEDENISVRDSGRIERNIAHEVRLHLGDFLHGATVEIRVNDPANPNGIEIFSLEVPPDTAPGARFRLRRGEPFAGGHVTVRVKAAAGIRFKASGSDVRCDLRIHPQRAANGGSEMLPGITGAMLRLAIPAGVGRGDVLRIPGEGLPKPRGGRGDLLVRITYRPEVRATRIFRR